MEDPMSDEERGDDDDVEGTEIRGSCKTVQDKGCVLVTIESTV